MADAVAPIVVKLGKASKKKISRLKDGKGPLVADVLEAMAHVKADLGKEAEGKELVPVVVVYRQKRKKRGFLD